MPAGSSVVRVELSEAEPEPEGAETDAVVEDAAAVPAGVACAVRAGRPAADVEVEEE